MVDTIVVNGPRDVSDGDVRIQSTQHQVVQWALPECGSGTVKYRTELTVKAKKEGASGTVRPEQVQYQGKTESYGIQQGISYDWEYCDA